MHVYVQSFLARFSNATAHDSIATLRRIQNNYALQTSKVMQISANNVSIFECTDKTYFDL